MTAEQAVALARVRLQLRAIQDALVDAFYDPDPTDPATLVDYSKVDWVGVIKDARRQLDALKAQVTLADDLLTTKIQAVVDRLQPILDKVPK